MKKFAAFLLALAMTPSLCVPTFAAEAPAELDVEERKEILLAQADVLTFGGMYYDEMGNLIYCQKGDISVEEMRTDAADLAISYKSVKYSLAELEEMAGLFIPYAKDYGIVAIDGNEQTNKVKLTVKEQTEALEKLVETLLDADVVTIEVLPAGTEIKETVKRWDYAEETTLTESGVDSVRASLVFPGMAIYVGTLTERALCTAGPRLNSRSFYTCGHVIREFTSAGLNVYNSAAPLGSVIATPGAWTYGANGDRCLITLTGTSSYALPTSNVTPDNHSYTLDGVVLAGETVKMYGAVSGMKSGTVIGTNLTVFDENGRSVGGLSSATYTCMLGDSGAGVFASSSTPYVCGGIQSLGAFQSGSNVSSRSYFSPLD